MLASDEEKAEIAESIKRVTDHLIENGVTIQQWISVEEQLPPPARCKQYLVYVRSGGGPYGDYEYNVDFAWWGEYWNRDGHGYDWNCICCDWDGDVTITHWMPLPEPPEVET